MGAFCNSLSQDQAAWTVLVLNRSLPIINTCVYMDGQKFFTDTHSRWCSFNIKSTNSFLHMLGERLFEVIESGDYPTVVPTNLSELECAVGQWARRWPDRECRSSSRCMLRARSADEPTF